MAPRKPSFMYLAQQRLHAQLTKIAEECGSGIQREQALEVVYHSLADGDDRTRIRELLEPNSQVLFVSKLLFDGAHALESMVIADTLIPLRAWSNALLTHSQTTGFAWGAFLNSAYQFREMMKSAYRQSEKVACLLGLTRPDPDDVRRTLKEAERCIGAHIALRGRNAHNYIEHNKAVLGMQSLELIRARGEKYERGGWFVARVKGRLRKEIQQAVLDCESILEQTHLSLSPGISAYNAEIERRVAAAGVTWGRDSARSLAS